MKWQIRRKLTDRQKVDIRTALAIQVHNCKVGAIDAATTGEREAWGNEARRYIEAYRAVFTRADRRALDQRGIPVPEGWPTTPPPDRRAAPRHDATTRQRTTGQLSRSAAGVPDRPRGDDRDSDDDSGQIPRQLD